MESESKAVVNSQDVESREGKKSTVSLSKLSYRTLNKCKGVLGDGLEKESVTNKSVESKGRQMDSKDQKFHSGKLAWTSNSSGGGHDAKNEANESSKESERTTIFSKDASDKKILKSRFAASTSKNTLNHSKSSPNKTHYLRREKERINQPSSRSLDRPNSWHGASPQLNVRKIPVRIHNWNRGVPPPSPNDQSKYSYNTTEFGCPYKPPKKPIVAWVSCNEGRVQPGAIVAGKEFNNPYTFIGRVTLRNERYNCNFH